MLFELSIFSVDDVKLHSFCIKICLGDGQVVTYLKIYGASRVKVYKFRQNNYVSIFRDSLIQDTPYS